MGLLDLIFFGKKEKKVEQVKKDTKKYEEYPHCRNCNDFRGCRYTNHGCVGYISKGKYDGELMEKCPLYTPCGGSLADRFEYANGKINEEYNCMLIDVVEASRELARKLKQRAEKSQKVLDDLDL